MYPLEIFSGKNHGHERDEHRDKERQRPGHAAALEPELGPRGRAERMFGWFSPVVEAGEEPIPRPPFENITAPGEDDTPQAAAQVSDSKARKMPVAIGLGTPKTAATVNRRRGGNTRAIRLVHSFQAVTIMASVSRVSGRRSKSP